MVARRAKKDPPNAGGWHAFLTSWVSADITNPIFTGFMNSACDKAMFGWPCDAEMEKLRDEFARETDPAKQKAIAEAVQVRDDQVVTHIPLGQWYLGVADAQERRRHADGAGAGVLEHRDASETPRHAAAAAGAAGLPTADRHLMLAYVLRRLVATIPVMLIVAVLVFLMLRLTPSDPGRHHRRRQCQLRAGRRDPQAARPRPADPHAVRHLDEQDCCRAISASRSSSRSRWPS